MAGLRQRTAKKKSRSKPVQINGDAGASKGDNVAVATSVAGALLDYSLPLLLVFGGCCSYVSHFSRLLILPISPSSNVWAYEELLRADSSAGVYWITLFRSFADLQTLLAHRTRAHLFADALYRRAAATLFRDMGHIASATQAAPGPHIAVAPPRHHIRVWDATKQHRIRVQRSSHNTNHISFCRYSASPPSF
jgi:hypothetical protein